MSYLNQVREFNIEAMSSNAYRSQVVGWNGMPLVKEDIDAIHRSIYLLDEARKELVALDSYVSEEVDKDASWFDAPQEWDDETMADGFNFQDTWPHAAFDMIGRIYVVRYVIELANPNHVPIAILVRARVIA